MASSAILVHTAGEANPKNTLAQPKSNQHQLAPTNPPQQENSRGDGAYGGNYRGHGPRQHPNYHGHGNGGNSNNRDDQGQGGGRCEFKRGYNENRGRGQENSSRGHRKQWDGNNYDNHDRDNRERGAKG